MNASVTEDLMSLPENVHKMEKYKEAIRTRNLQDVKKYFKIFKFNIYEDDIGVRPALHYAILYDKGRCDIIRFIISQGEDIERYFYQDSFIEEQIYGFKPSYGEGDIGPLAYAVVHKRADAAITLLRLGANPYGRPNTLETPMIFAALMNNEDDAILYTFILLRFAHEKYP